jgi:hypothetical protein
MNGTIKGVYNKSLDGEEYKAKTGTYFFKVLIAGEGDEKVYETFYLTPKAQWKVEALFECAGAVAPAFDDLVFSNFEALIGNNVNVSIRKNDAGYNEVAKWLKPLPKEKVEADEVAPIDPVAEQGAGDPTDPDLDEDVPF